jgi:cytochrome c oxidase cbb3-type subunit 4
MELDINTFRGLTTVVLMIAFIGMVRWAYSTKRKQDFTEAANLALDDGQPAERVGNKA